MAEHNAVVGIYTTHTEAEAAVKALQRTGFDMQKLSIVGKDYHTEEHVIGYYTTGDRMQVWGKRGAFWGGFWGLLVGSGFFVIPGIGPLLVFGPLVGWIIGALEGAVVGGGLSALGAGLYSLGIPTNSIVEYETALKSDQFLVMAYGTRDEVAQAQRMLEAAGAAGAGPLPGADGVPHPRGAPRSDGAGSLRVAPGGSRHDCARLARPRSPAPPHGAGAAGRRHRRGRGRSAVCRDLGRRARSPRPQTLCRLAASPARGDRRARAIQATAHDRVYPGPSGARVTPVELAAVAQTSPSHFARLFKCATGQTPHQYVITCRMEQAKRLLVETDIPLIDIASQVGCADHSHFTALFRQHVGTTPKVYRTGRNRGEGGIPISLPYGGDQGIFVC